MTEKRFVMDEDGNITDTFDNRTLYVENRYTECNYFCKILNELHKENKNLKDFAQHNYSETKKIINNLQKENEQLKLELDIHKHPLWSTREAERKINELTNLLSDEIKKNAILLEEINSLRIENMRLKKVKE